ncbi:aromatic ring-hydroxylating dioxygenase subunit alpha [Frankia sp. AgB1.9]|uniref:aromatic ring-hydroxylating oxygenase subunit alpha n=1 Tax=unclassified Frankia TaxID=2632575 RepID=UPI0019343A20|nr:MULTISPECIES: aromatic ring-hydroxylating dioxygenase subunit alpha [unclassified Frankia]MBL7488235.1 aromatic ring-hydroxylating dioxygenase subunit alpha [Frankia sp. AgW1.1]MBL7548122.1 aromatic ring-hydroxylating dioxygenase subunit alpha [Frankia sp. AgB1.9]MBL7620348.1 aromatic ring-hydroxylating dioxygenase subunit alpha [Frankia sp. AgB1.8]
MNVEMQRELGRRTLDLIDRRTTDLAEHTMEEPLDGYRSPEQFERERRLVFSRYPMFVGLSGDLPEPESWLTFDATGTPMLLTRDDDGRVRAFLNMCQHRGVRVVEPGRGTARRFTCPFHAWSYSLEGKLVGLPGSEGFNDLRREDRGLIELPVQERHGLIFAAAHPDARFSLEEYFGGLDEHFASFGFESWHSIAATHRHPVATNWKVVWGTHCETYHFAQLHRATAGPLVYSNTSVADFYGDHALMTSTMRTVDKLRETPEEDWRPVDDGQINLNYRLFPNLSFSVVGDRLEIFTIYPGESLHETVALHYAYRRELPASDQEAKELEEAVRWACQTVVDKEDYEMATRAGLGLRSPFVPKTLVFGRNEPVMQHMARTLRRVLAEAPE